MQYMSHEEWMAHARRSDAVSRAERDEERRRHFAHVEELAQHMAVTREHMNRQTAAMEAIAAHFSPPAPEPTAFKPGCGKPAGGSFCGEPPAQAATEVTHAEALECLRRVQAASGMLTYDWAAMERYIDQQSRRDAAAQADPQSLNSAIHEARHVLGEALYPGLGGDSPPGVANTLWAFAHEAARRLAAQAAPRVEGDPLWAVKWAAAFLQGPDGAVPTKPFDALVAKLHEVAAEARASALPPGAAEALREWRALGEETSGPVFYELAAPERDERMAPHHARAYDCAARLLRALASGADAP